MGIKKIIAYGIKKFNEIWDSKVLLKEKFKYHMGLKN